MTICQQRPSDETQPSGQGDAKTEETPQRVPNGLLDDLALTTTMQRRDVAKRHCTTPVENLKNATELWHTPYTASGEHWLSADN